MGIDVTILSFCMATGKISSSTFGSKEREL
jgi:hypothetical protein